MDERLAVAPIGILELSPDGVIETCNERAGEILDFDPSTVSGQPIDAVFPESVEDTVPNTLEGKKLLSLEFEEYYPGPDRWLAISIEQIDEVVLVYVQDVTSRHNEQQRRQRVRSDLDRMTITNELISDLLGALVNASTREEIAATICDRLGETDLYEFAWIGERELGGDGLVVRASDGETGRTLEAIAQCLDSGRALPERRAIEAGSPTIVQPLGEDDSVPKPIRRAAFADGHQSLLAIPLQHGADVYGVVGIYSATQDAFTPRERASFGTVGELAGFAINAARHRTILRSDSVIELTVKLTDSAAPLLSAVTQTGGSLLIDGIVPQRDSVHCYGTVENQSIARMAAALVDVSGVTGARTISETDGGGTLEITLEETTPLGILTSHGITVKRAEYSEDGGECVLELAPAADVRRIVDSLTREYDASVVAKRRREREWTTPETFRHDLRSQLTEKQEEALRTAFFAEYFQSPRGSTAAEVANALNITGPTLLYHLRAGQRKLFAELFDATGDRRPE